MADDIKKQTKDNGSDNEIRPMKVSLRPDITELIGQRLRKYYDEVAYQPVPDRFLSLLDKLDEATSSKKPK